MSTLNNDSIFILLDFKSLKILLKLKIEFEIFEIGSLL